MMHHSVSPNGSNIVLRNTRLQMLTMLTVGALSGWLAASGRLQTLARAQGTPQASATLIAPTAPCYDGAERGGLLAKPDAIPATLVAQLPTQAPAAALTVAAGPAEAAILFEILVPADAVLEIEG